MTKIDYFEFGKKDFEYICEECMLNEEFKKLLEMKIKDYSRVQISLELNKSVDAIDKMIAKLTKKIKKIL